jgi:hypothetical protein
MPAWACATVATLMSEPNAGRVLRRRGRTEHLSAQREHPAPEVLVKPAESGAVAEFCLFQRALQLGLVHAVLAFGSRVLHAARGEAYTESFFFAFPLARTAAAVAARPAFANWVGRIDPCPFGAVSLSCIA